MIIDATYFLESGLPTSDDIREDEVTLAIRTVEHAVVKERLGTELYSAILADSAHQYDDAVNGTDEVAGLKFAELHLVFGYMLYDRTRLVRYASVVKNDEHSENPSRHDVLASSKNHWELGLQFLDECCKFLEVPKQEGVHNNLVFGELIF